MAHGRPLLAARTTSGDDNSAAGGASPASSSGRAPAQPGSARAKRTLIESACSACRRRKSRCDGQRPMCSRCQSLRTDCHYEAEEGESRWSALRRRNQVLETERDQLRELLHYVQTKPESEALDLFQRIRQTSYDELFLLLRHMKENAMSLQQQQQALMAPGMSPSVTTSIDQRLPPIQAILDPARGMPPPQLAHSQSLSSEESRSSTDAAMGSLAPGHRHPLETLEPSLRSQGRPPLLMSISSEESSGSIGSVSMPDMQNQNPYYYIPDPSHHPHQGPHDAHDSGGGEYKPH